MTVGASSVLSSYTFMFDLTRTSIFTRDISAELPLMLPKEKPNKVKTFSYISTQNIILMKFNDNHYIYSRFIYFKECYIFK